MITLNSNLKEFFRELLNENEQLKQEVFGLEIDLEMCREKLANMELINNEKDGNKNE